MVFCGKCGTCNPDDNTFCRQCGFCLFPEDNPGKQTHVEPKREHAMVETTKDHNNQKKVIAACVAVMMVIVAIAAIFVMTSDTDDSEKGPIDVASPVNGNYQMVGWKYNTDKTEYHTSVASINIVNGSIVQKDYNNSVEKIPVNESSGVDLKRPVIDASSVHTPGCQHLVSMPPYKQTHQSIIDVNPFLKGATYAGTIEVKIAKYSSYKSVCGFKVPSGDIYYVTEDGKLMGYAPASSSVDILLIPVEYSTF